jgi:hypothetical protein
MEPIARYERITKRGGQDEECFAPALRTKNNGAIQAWHDVPSSVKLSY